MRFTVLMAVTMMHAFFWDVTTCSLVKFTDISEELQASFCLTTT